MQKRRMEEKALRELEASLNPSKRSRMESGEAATTNQPDILRSKVFTFDDLPEDVRDLIYRRVRFSTLFRAYRAGLGCDDLSGRSLIKNVVQHRIASMKPLWERFQGGRDFEVPLKRKRCKPTVFSKLDDLKLDIKGWTNVPEGIGELKKLETLMMNACQTGPKLVDLPSSLAQCSRLRRLDLTGNNFEAIPAVILKLKYLEVLNLRRNKLLTCLPDNIGTQLTELEELDIRGCRRIKSLPESVLEHFNQDYFLAEGLKLNPSAFPPTYFTCAEMRENYINIYNALSEGILFGIFID